MCAVHARNWQSLKTGLIQISMKDSTVARQCGGSVYTCRDITVACCGGNFVFALGDGTVITIRRQCMTSRRVLQLESAPQGSAVKLYNNKKYEKSNCQTSTTNSETAACLQTVALSRSESAANLRNDGSRMTSHTHGWWSPCRVEARSR